MKIAALLLFAFLMPLFLPQAAIAHAQQKPEDLGQKSAKAWLALTDSGKYAESWDQASASFKAAVSKDNWVGMVSSVRGPLGALQSRKLATAEFVKNRPTPRKARTSSFATTPVSKNSPPPSKPFP